METILASKAKTVVIGPDRPFVVIGERINPSGRKKLAAEMAVGDISRVRRDALAQVAAGAHVLDVNAGVPMVDEAELLAAAVRAVTDAVDVPLCLDSSVVEALQAALQVYEGKPLVNSVTGEDERLEAILPLVKKHGAAVIGMANDETGISNDPEYRLSVARKIVQRARDYGIPPQDVIVDPLALTVAADSQAVQVTLETMKRVRAELGVNMVCGASNVSFGLPDRPTVNATYLPMAMLCGLTCAITDPTVPAIQQAVLAGDLLMGHDEYAARWIANYRESRKTATNNQ